MISFKSIVRHDNLIPLIALIFGLCIFFRGEVIPVAGGLGYDGTVYAEITRTFPHAILGKYLDAYRFQRILPSGIVYLGLSLFRKSITDYKILTTFKLYNLGMFVLAAFIYVLIARELKFDLKTRWLGFLCLFLNVAVAKHYFYYPVATDQTAFALGMLLLFFFLKDNKMGVLIITFLGSFTWPLMIYYGVLLYIFPKKAIGKDKVSDRYYFLLSSLVVCVFLALIIWVYFIKMESMPNGTAQVVAPVVYLSILSVLAYVFCGLKTALDNIGIPGFQTVIRSTSVSRFIVGLLVLISVKYTVSSLTNSAGSLTAQWLFQGIALNSIVRPFGSFVANVVYYGPVLLLTTFLWKPFIQIVRQHGLGLSLFIIGNFFLSINTESRMLMPALPFFVIFTAMATQELKLGPSFYWFVGIISFLYSKVWLRMNTIGPMTGEPLQFPLQIIFMNHGPWMSNQMYIIQGIFVLVTGMVLLLLIKWPRLFDNKDGLPE